MTKNSVVRRAPRASLCYAMSLRGAERRSNPPERSQIGAGLLRSARNYGVPQHQRTPDPGHYTSSMLPTSTYQTGLVASDLMTSFRYPTWMFASNNQAYGPTWFISRCAW
jgi:hypothetical protein